MSDTFTRRQLFAGAAATAIVATLPANLVAAPAVDLQAILERYVCLEMWLCQYRNSRGDLASIENYQEAEAQCGDLYEILRKAGWA